MSNDQLLDKFFKMTYERHINEEMLELKYVFPQDEVLQYVKDLCAVSYQEFIVYILRRAVFSPYQSGDVTQLSNIENCHENICRIMLGEGDPGLTFEKLGMLLQNDGIERDKKANTKYGENQVKTARQLGLTWELCGLWYLTCFGRIFNHLDTTTQNALMARCLLRDKFYAKVISAAYTSDISIVKLMRAADLSPSTIQRRLPNVRCIVRIILNTLEHNLLYDRLQMTLQEKVIAPKINSPSPAINAPSLPDPQSSTPARMVADDSTR